MDLPLRLQTALSMLSSTQSIADIGTDHAKLPIAAVTKKICEYAYAIDKNHGPANAAKQAVKAAGFSDRIKILLGDGLSPLIEKALSPQAVIIAGLGGETTVKILQDGDKYLNSLKTDPAAQLILQPQTDLKLVRQTIFAVGFSIIDERLISENGHFYEIIKAVPDNAAPPYSPSEMLTGRYLKQHSETKLWRDYAAAKIAKLERAISGRAQGKNADSITTQKLKGELTIWQNELP